MASWMSVAVARRRVEVGTEELDGHLRLDARENVVEAVRNRLSDVERHALQ